MALHLFKGSMMALKDIVKISGIKSNLLSTAKYSHPEKSYDQIVADYKPILFTWD